MSEVAGILMGRTAIRRRAQRLILCACLAVAGASTCPAKLHAGEPAAKAGSPSSRAISIEGPIDKALVNHVIAALMANARINTVYVTSLGGDTAEALRLGRAFVNRRISVVARRACISACAQYLFIPSATRRTSGPTLVALHNTATDADLALEGSGARVGQAYYANLRRQEDALYRRAGISPALLALGLVGLDVRCVRIDPSPQIIAFKRVQLLHRYASYTATPSVLRHFGVRGDLEAFNNDAATERTLIGLAGLNSAFTVNHLSTFETRPDSGRPAGSSIVQC